MPTIAIRHIQQIYASQLALYNVAMHPSLASSPLDNQYERRMLLLVARGKKVLC